MMMTAEDVGAALAGFALSLAPLLSKQQTPSGLLDALAIELRGMVDGMTRHGDEGTPAAAALLIAAAMLEATAPEEIKPSNDD
jgi:hypothetical protein